MIGPRKSILRFVEKSEGSGGPETPRGLANIAVNNHFDFEFFGILITSPQMIQQAVEHPLFDCIGHAYQIAYANIALVLASSCSTDLTLIPDPRKWEFVFHTLRDQKKKGFYSMTLGLSQMLNHVTLGQPIDE